MRAFAAPLNTSEKSSYEAPLLYLRHSYFLHAQVAALQKTLVQLTLIQNGCKFLSLGVPVIRNPIPNAWNTTIFFAMQTAPAIIGSFCHRTLLWTDLYRRSV
jgi:hypothetical protein